MNQQKTYYKVKSKTGLFNYFKSRKACLSLGPETSCMWVKITSGLARVIGYSFLDNIDRTKQHNMVIDYDNDLPSLRINSRVTGNNVDLSYGIKWQQINVDAFNRYVKKSGSRPAFDLGDGTFLCIQFNSVQQVLYSLPNAVNFIPMIKLRGKWWVLRDFAAGELSNPAKLIISYQDSPNLDRRFKIKNNNWMCAVVIKKFIDLIPV